MTGNDQFLAMTHALLPGAWWRHASVACFTSHYVTSPRPGLSPARRRSIHTGRPIGRHSGMHLAGVLAAVVNLDGASPAITMSDERAWLRHHKIQEDAGECGIKIRRKRERGGKGGEVINHDFFSFLNRLLMSRDPSSMGCQAQTCCFRLSSG